MMLQSCLTLACFFAGCLVIFAWYALFYLYTTKVEGDLFLEKAPGVVRIAREVDTQIPRIKADNWKGIAYGQGFFSA